jgi:tetratricopeptide (TPR) repeat protein
MNSTHLRRAVLLIALGAAARAGASDAILGRDDAAFARQLLKAGYTDLAERVCKTIEEQSKNGKVDPKDVADVQALLLDLDLEVARNEADPMKRKDLIGEVIEKKEAFVKQHADSLQADEIRNNLPDAYRLLGESLTAALQKETDGPKIFRLRTEGENTFKHAEEQLEARFEKLKEAHDADPPMELDIPLMAAAYNVPRTYYFHSLLYPADDKKKKDLLEKAIEGFQEFGLDYSDQLLNFESFIYQGLCHKDLGKTKEALLDFDDAIKLRETYRKTPQNQWAMTDDAVAIVASAALQKVLLYNEQKEFAKAIETAQEFAKTTPDPLSTTEGLAILAAQADAQNSSGDAAAASKTAQQLVDADPQGPWGARGREILGKSISGGGSGAKNLGSERLLRVAETLTANGDYDRAIQVCHEAVEAARGTDEEPNVGTDAFLLIGKIFNKRGMLHEAVVAFDTPAERFPTGDHAADAVFAAVTCYRELGKQEKRPYYTKRVDQRMQLLADKYPKSTYAAQAQLIEAKKLEDDEKWLQAADFYHRIQPSTPGYEEALLGEGQCYLLAATKARQDKRNDEATTFLTQAETQLKKAIAETEQRSTGTLDKDVLARLGTLSFSARSLLASLYLLEGLNREGEVFKLFEDADTRYAAEPEKLSRVWTFRIQALKSQGKLDDAIGLLEALIQKSPGAKSVGAAAGALARALDARAAELLAKDPQSKQANDYWDKAQRYYVLSTKDDLAGGVAKSSELEGVANRLFVIACHFNGVPDDVVSFVGWKGGTGKANTTWERAAELYEAALAATPSYRTAISLARTYGFLGKWDKASQTYARLFEQEPLINKQTGKFNTETIRAKPELLDAYLESGVAEHQTALVDKDKERFLRAGKIFDTMCANTEANSKRWWQSKYYLIRNLVDRGEYKDADIALRSVERTTNDYDGGKYGFKPLFLELKTQLAGKSFPSTAPATPPKSAASPPGGDKDKDKRPPK